MSFDYCNKCGSDFVETEEDIYVCENCGNVLDLSMFSFIEDDNEEDEG